MHDIELLLCTHRTPPEIPFLLEKLGALDEPRERRAALLPRLRALLIAELETSSARWTPHYDRALRELSGTTDEEILEPHWSYDPDPTRHDPFAAASRSLATHDRLCDQLLAAEARGARTLAGAYASMPIDDSELHAWFALCPDQAALDRRLRDAAIAYLRATPDRSRELEEELLDAVERGLPVDEIHGLRMRWFHLPHSLERRSAFGIAFASKPAADRSFVNTPPELRALLGNPFDPLVAP